MTAKRARLAPPPAGQSQPATGWWKRPVTEYDINDPAGELLPEMAIRAFDRAEQAREQLDRDGCTALDSRGPEAPPSCQRRMRQPRRGCWRPCTL